MKPGPVVFSPNSDLPTHEGITVEKVQQHELLQVVSEGSPWWACLTLNPTSGPRSAGMANGDTWKSFSTTVGVTVVGSADKHSGL